MLWRIKWRCSDYAASPPFFRRVFFLPLSVPWTLTWKRSPKPECKKEGPNRPAVKSSNMTTFRLCSLASRVCCSDSLSSPNLLPSVSLPGLQSVPCRLSGPLYSLSQSFPAASRPVQSLSKPGGAPSSNWLRKGKLITTVKEDHEKIKYKRLKGECERGRKVTAVKV